MFVGALRFAALFVVGLACAGGFARAEGFVLSETKERLKLGYEMTVTDHGTGRVTVNLTLSDEGRLAPIDSVDLNVPNEDGTNYVDLSLALEPRQVDGKKFYTVHGKRELLERAALQLQSRRLDGEQEELTFYVHSIPVAEHLEGAAKKAEK